MNKQKVKAFTILEVTITMLITGLLIGITYTSYSIVVQSYKAFSVKNDEIAVLVTLDHLLKRDFDKAEIIYKTQDGLMFKQDNQIVNYEFMPDYILRSSARIDTFKVQTQAIITTFVNMPINEVQETEEQNRVDGLGFTIIYKTEQIPYLYHKQYSSVTLMQRTTNALN